MYCLYCLPVPQDAPEGSESEFDTGDEADEAGQYCLYSAFTPLRLYCLYCLTVPQDAPEGSEYEFDTGDEADEAGQYEGWRDRELNRIARDRWAAPPPCSAWFLASSSYCNVTCCGAWCAAGCAAACAHLSTKSK